MKVILSRKGFDSAYGGIPSPILDDRKLISLPIPSISNTFCYKDLKLDDNRNYRDLIIDLRKGSKKLGCVTCGGKSKSVDELSCHLDPDIYDRVIERQPGWRGLFGQSGSAQGHLKKKGNEIQPGDVFLFFGWFRRAKCGSEQIRYVQAAPDLQVIFGYLEVGDIWEQDVIESDKFPKWAKYHPHYCDKTEKNAVNNTIYAAANSLSWDNEKPGWGVFHFDEKLVLTEKGLSRSKWKLKGVFEEETVSLSYHDMKKSRIKEQQPKYFQSARIGQEFVFNENKMVEAWAKTLI